MPPMLRLTTSVRYSFHAVSSLVAGAVSGAAATSLSASSFLQAASPITMGSTRQAISRRVVFFIVGIPVWSCMVVALPLRLQRGGHRRRHETGDIAAKAGDL